ncbi:hypothetical protein Tco_0153857 [Tanacetum coccineum]
MIDVNNQKDSVSLLPLSGKKKKRMSQTPTDDYEQSHSLSSGTVPDPQDPERNIQLAGMRLPFILDEGTRKSQPLLEGTTTDPKDSVGNKQPINTGLPSTVSDEDIQAYLLSENELAQESDEEEVFAAGDDMDEDTQANEE